MASGGGNTGLTLAAGGGNMGLAGGEGNKGQRKYYNSGYHALLVWIGPKHTEKICEGER